MGKRGYVAKLEPLGICVSEKALGILRHLASVEKATAEELASCWADEKQVKAIMEKAGIVAKKDDQTYSLKAAVKKEIIATVAELARKAEAKAAKEGK